jgi:hypothetical protein
MDVLMFGTGTFAEPTLQALLSSRHRAIGLVTNPDRPSGKGKDRRLQRGIKELALEANLPVFQPENVNSAQSVAHIRRHLPADWSPLTARSSPPNCCRFRPAARSTSTPRSCPSTAARPRSLGPS